MNAKLNADAMLAIVFDSIESVKNLNDDNASKNEKMTVEQAKAINNLVKSGISIYKLKVEAAKLMSESDSPVMMKNEMKQLGVGTDD